MKLFEMRLDGFDGVALRFEGYVCTVVDGGWSCCGLCIWQVDKRDAAWKRFRKSQFIFT